MYVQPYSVIKNKQGEIGIYMYGLQDENTWHRASFPSSKEWNGRKEDFKVIAPPIRYEIGDTVKVLLHTSFNVSTWKQNYEFIEGMLVHWTRFTDVATVMINGEEHMVKKHNIFPLKFGNVAHKNVLERGE